MANKKRSQYPLLAGGSIVSATRFDIIDANTNYTVIYGDLSGAEGTIGLLYKLYQDLTGSYTQVDYTADTTNYLNLGLSSAYRYVEIEYIMERGTKYRGGTIRVVHDGTTSYAQDTFQGTEEDNSWAYIQPTVNGGTQIQIQIDCDNSDANDTKFNYKITKRIPVAS